MRARFAIAAVCSLAAAQAWAQASGFIRTQVPNTDLCIFWGTRVLTYSPNQAGYSQTNVFPAIDAAYTTWETLATSCSDFNFVKGAQIPNETIGYDPTSSNNYNAIIFREQNCAMVVPANDPCIAASTCNNVYGCWQGDDSTIALTTTTFDNTTGVIYDADTEFNASPHVDGSPAYLFTTVDSPPCTSTIAETCVATDVQETMTHETGHAIGLAHVNIAGSTMEPTAPIGETQKRILDPGTSAGFCTIYPRGLPTPSCDPNAQLDQRIQAIGKGTPGLQNVGCSSAGSALVALLGPVAAMTLRRRRSRLR